MASHTHAHTASLEDALRYADAHRDDYLEELKDFLRIPSISTLPKHRKDIKKAAKFVAGQLEGIGLRKVKLVKTDGHPLVYGEWIEAAGKPTVLLYGHYDVQPVDPLALWQSDPFEPEVRGENLYARGAVDDKGQVFALLKALDTLMRSRGNLPVNVKVIVEGEEEAGGESIAAYVPQHAKKLACDVALVADTGMPAPGVPALVYGLRGILYTEILTQGARHDLHSGEYGGVGPNPIHALAQVLVGLKGPDGRITIPELYERMTPMTAEERALWERNPVDVVASMKEEMGVDYLPGEQEFDPRERATARPTLEVHGIRGGFVDEGAKTVIPAEAVAKVSLRLPPGLTPEAVFPWLERRVAELCPPGVTMTVRFIHGGDPVFVPLDNMYVRAAERALEAEWGVKPVFERSGGSIPVGALFDSVLHAPVIFMGTGLPDDNVHAPNEKYSIPNFYHLIRQAVRFLDIIGGDPAILARPEFAAVTAKSGKNGKNGNAAGASGASGADSGQNGHAGDASTADSGHFGHASGARRGAPRAATGGAKTAKSGRNGNAGRQVGGTVPGILPEEVEDDVTGPAPTGPAGPASAPSTRRTSAQPAASGDDTDEAIS